MNGNAVPAPLAETHPAEEASNSLLSWVTTVDHKRIGLLYLWTAFFFFLIGGLEALAIRVQLAQPESHFLSPEAFDQIFTMHGTTMVFLVLMPLFAGLANYFVPLMIGARDMAFPRLNAMSYWFLLFGGLLLHFSFVAGGAPSAGWFAYAPLSEQAYSFTTGVDYWILSLVLLGVGSIATSVNLVATVLNLRASGLTFRRLPLFVWVLFVNSFLIILAMPALNAAAVLLLFDRLMGSSFYIATHGGSTLLWQHFFWTFGHPEVYILALPAFGIISEVVPVFSRKPIFGYEFIAASTVAIALLSFGVWAHHMFAVGMGHPMDIFFAVSSMLIAVPTGVKIFNWSATLWGGAIRMTTAMCFAVAFILQFTIGGLSGVTFAVVPIDWQVTDTYYLVAHFHYVLVGGSLFAAMAGIYYWFPKMSGRMLSERLGKWNFWTAVIGFNMAFFVQHFLGLMGMRRRVYTYADHPYWGTLNMISTVGAFILGVSMMIMAWNIFLSLKRGRVAGDNPWEAWTLEWAASSPPHEHNFEAVPPVRSRRPLWDLARPDLPDEAGAEGGESTEPKFGKLTAGVLSFLASEAFFFILLIIAFIYYNYTPPKGPSAATVLDLTKTSIFTVCLLLSSGTYHMAERSLESGKHAGFRAWLAATLLLGGTFLVGQGREYLGLYENNVTFHTNLFSSSFFTLTGFHGLHVAIGLVALAIVLGLALAGDFKPGRPGKVEAVKAVGYYWHFVDAVWIVVFSVVYLRGFML